MPFDQLSATAHDETSRQADGVLSGFQKAVGTNYVKSDGVFSLSVNTPSTIGEETDITADYLTNTQAAFRHTDDIVGGGNALEAGTAASTWKGDMLPAEDTGVYVDTPHGGNLTFTTSWEGFSSDGIDKILYQTITLPAGTYRFSATSKTADNSDDCLLVATLGDELATFSGIATSLASAPLNQGSVIFTMPSEAKVSLGVLYNLPAYSTSAISSFRLSRLQSEILTANPDDVTGIGKEEVVKLSDQWSAVNGVHTLSGQKVKAPQKGQIYIIDGKAVKY